MSILSPEDMLLYLGSEIGTPLQQVILTFREIDRTFSTLQKMAEL